MKIYIVWTILILTSFRVSEFYSQEDYKGQAIRNDLTERLWKLTDISCNRNIDTTLCNDFKTNADGCSFIYRFMPQGELQVFYKGRNLSGTYLINSDKFKHFHGGWKDKVVWTQYPECKVNPGDLSYALHTYGGPADFKIVKDTLVIKTARQTTFKFLAIN